MQEEMKLKTKKASVIDLKYHESIYCICGRLYEINYSADTNATVTIFCGCGHTTVCFKSK